MSTRLLPVPMFADNYLWLHVSGPWDVIAVDPGDYALLDRLLQAEGGRLTTVFVTHHHADHCGGLPALRAAHPEATVFGPDGIEGVTVTVRGGDTLNLGAGGAWEVIAVPGHTRDHLAFFNRAEAILFCGDTLFSGGCGRIFDGDALSLHHSLELLAALPDHTRICCAHEYTLANLAFARHIDPDNTALAEYQAKCSAAREADYPTLPSVLSVEKLCNPFLRCGHPAIQHALAALTGDTVTIGDTAQTFRAMRRLKDTWKPFPPEFP